MSHIDLHPDELFDALRAGRLDAAGEQRLRAHCRQCEACAMELTWAEARLHSQAPDARDEARAQRALSALLGEPAAGGEAEIAPEPTADAQPSADGAIPRRRTRRWQLALAGALLMLSGSSAAALWTGKPLIVHLSRLVEAVGLQLRDSPEAPTQAAPAAARTVRPKARPREAQARLSAPAVRPAAPLPAAPPPATPPEVTDPAVSVPTVATRRVAPRDRDESAEQLMRRGARLRARGDSASAAEAYGRVTRRFPRSRHAQVARVALGNLRLHRLRDAAAARAAFASYLQHSPKGPLSEEALSGLALAHRRLGDDAAEAETWRRLLSAHPTSPYASGARGRLLELGEAPAQEGP